MKIKLDNLDYKILYELDRNCRQSVQQVAKKIGSHRDVVNYRINRLQKLKVIEGSYCLIDFAKLGYLSVRLYIRLQNSTLEIEKEMVDYLVSDKRTFLVYRTEVAWDIATGLLVRSLNEFDELLRSFQSKFQKYIHSQNLSVIYELVLYPRKYLSASEFEPVEWITGSKQQIKLSENEFEVIKNLASNANMSLVVLANKLKVTPAAIKYIIKKLEKEKLILAYKAIIDFNKLGYKYYKVDFTLEDINQRSALQKFAKQHPNVVYEDRTIGGSDLEFDLELKDESDLYAWFDLIKEKFPGLLRAISYYRARKSYKYSYMPE